MFSRSRMSIPISNKMIHPCLLHLVILLSAAALAVASRGDVEALQAFKNAVQDPGNVLQTWDPASSDDPCAYFHVTCDGDNRVTRVDLGGANMSGNLVPELGMLDRLQNLELYMNKLEGTIPKELGGLKNLLTLELYKNKLTGSIPSSFSNLSNLRVLQLNDNKLTGCVPAGLTKIPILDLSNNNLSGTCRASDFSNKSKKESFTNNPDDLS